METLWQDVRFGMRMIVKSPSIAMVAVVTLAVGIGANTAIFSVVDGVLLRPLPYVEADRLVMLWEHSRAGGKPRNVISPANYLDWRDRSRSFESSALLLDVRRSLTGGSEPEEIAVQGVTIDFFPMLGTTPLIGRDFAPEDATPDAPGVVLISHGLWKRRFGLDPGVIGSSIPLGGRPYEVIGVMPPRAGLFVPEGSLTGARPECWMPLGLTERSRIRQGRFAMAVARLVPGVTLESAQSELDSIASRLEQENVEFNTGWGVNVVPLKDQLVGEIRPALLVLLGAVGFVLLAACANVGSLMLARTSQREREVAIRAALGAGRRRIVRQLLTECVLLACMGGIGGVILAWWGLDLLLALAPQDALPDSPLGLDLRVLVFALGAAGLSGVLFGVLPALLGARSDLHTALKDGGRSASSGPRRRRAQGAFVVTQVALALVLLVGSGLLIRSFGRLAGVDPGFDARDILTLRLQLPGAKYGEDHQRVAFFSELTRRVAAMPGVRSVGINTFAPFTGSGSATTCLVDGRPLPPPGESPVCDVRMVDSGFFATLGIPLISGRLFTQAEMTEARHVVVVNESLARQLFPGEDPLGRRLIIEMSDEPVPTEIIGVVGDVLHASLDSTPRPMTYWPHPELALSSMTLVVRASGDPLGLVGPIRTVVRSLDADQPIGDIHRLEDRVAGSMARSRFATTLLSVFAGMALLLAAVGVYGVIACAVSTRTHEIGVRMALGARAADVLRLLAGEGMTLVGAGVAIGIAAALGLTRLLGGLLFGIRPTDPITFVSIPILLVAVALAACLIPARRALRVDPLRALRQE